MAGFIAVTSFITGVVSEIDKNNKLVVKTEDNLPIHAIRPGFKIGDKISVAIRINTVRFVNRENRKKDLMNVFEGDILQASYLGDIIDYRIRLGKWMIRTDSKTQITYQVGDHVHIYLPPEELIITPEGV